MDDTDSACDVEAECDGIRVGVGGVDWEGKRAG